MRNLPCPRECPWFKGPCHGVCPADHKFVRHFVYGPTDFVMIKEERDILVEGIITENSGTEKMGVSRVYLEGLSDQELAKVALDSKLKHS